MTEYHKIETLYERDEKTFKIKEPFVLKNRAYGLIKTWEWTQKIDGTNIRVMWKPNGIVHFGGRQDSSNFDMQLLKYLQDTFTVAGFEKVFSPENLINVVIYGEGFGAGIQKGGGSYSPHKRFIAFDVLVTTYDPESDKNTGWWLSRENVEDIADKFSVPVVPYFGSMTLEEATEMVRNGISSRVGTKQAEGLVGRPCEALFDKKGARLIVKLKTKDFAPLPVKQEATV